MKNDSEKTREDFILDRELQDYYKDMFSVNTPVNSIGKTNCMKKIHNHHHSKKQLRMIVGSLSVAALIGVSIFFTSNFTNEAKIDSNIPFIE